MSSHTMSCARVMVLSNFFFAPTLLRNRRLELGLTSCWFRSVLFTL